MRFVVSAAVLTAFFSTEIGDFEMMGLHPSLQDPLRLVLVPAAKMAPELPEGIYF